MEEWKLAIHPGNLNTEFVEQVPERGLNFFFQHLLYGRQPQKPKFIFMFYTNNRSRTHPSLENFPSVTYSSSLYSTGLKAWLNTLATLFCKATMSRSRSKVFPRRIPAGRNTLNNSCSISPLVVSWNLMWPAIFPTRFLGRGCL